MAEKEAKPEVKGEDVPDVAAQRAREKSSEEEGQYPDIIFHCDSFQSLL